MVRREDLTIELGSRRVLGDDDVYVMAREWSFTVVASLPTSGDSDDDFKDWKIGHGSASIVDIERAAAMGTDISDALDAMSADLSHLSMLFDGGDFALDLPVAEPWGAVLLLEHLQIEAGSRGLGLGPVVLAGVIDQLQPGCSFAALVPAPIGDPIDGKTRPEAVAALQRIWGQVGFQPFRDGICLLDLATDAFDEPRRRLLGF